MRLSVDEKEFFRVIFGYLCKTYQRLINIYDNDENYFMYRKNKTIL